MTDDELEAWLGAYLTRNPGKRAMIEGSFTVSPPPQTRREAIERLQREDDAAQESRRLTEDREGLPPRSDHPRSCL
jgi:hypothetical protein